MTKKDKAKRVLIQDLYTGDLKPFGDKLRGKCPFHRDMKQPNFFIYTKTNTWYCFANCRGGDVIDFYMKQHNCSFLEAIEALTTL